MNGPGGPVSRRGLLPPLPPTREYPAPWVYLGVLGVAAQPTVCLYGPSRADGRFYGPSGGGQVLAVSMDHSLCLATGLCRWRSPPRPLAAGGCAWNIGSGGRGPYGALSMATELNIKDWETGLSPTVHSRIPTS